MSKKAKMTKWILWGVLALAVLGSVVGAGGEDPGPLVEDVRV